VKASRLFAGYDHEQQVRRLADYFQCSPAAATAVGFDPECIAGLQGRRELWGREGGGMGTASVFGRRDLGVFESFEQAYHCLMMDIMDQQAASTRLVLQGADVRRIFVDGGFGKNKVYMHLLAEAFPDIEVFAASISQATALGAALAIHRHWNEGEVPGDIIELRIFRG
jgi:hypothetical protein